MKEKDLKVLFESFLRKSYYENIVFWWSPAFKHLRWDIFGVFDCVCISTQSGRIEFIQITTTPNTAARRHKIQKWLGYTFDQRPTGLNFLLYSWDSRKGIWRGETL